MLSARMGGWGRGLGLGEGGRKGGQLRAAKTSFHLT
jgi:hypothetical protein